MKELIIQKLTSRKFWTAVATIVSGVVLLFGYADTTAETVAGAVLIIGGAMSFNVSEGTADAVERIVRMLKGTGIIIGALKDGPEHDEGNNENDTDDTENDTDDNENDTDDNENDTDDNEAEGGADDGIINAEQNL